MSPDVRDPAVAGHFYPADPGELREMVERLLASVEAEGEDAEACSPKAVIAPHAGYAYSGPVAASKPTPGSVSSRSAPPGTYHPVPSPIRRL